MNKYDEDYDAGNGDGCVVLTIIVVSVLIAIDIFLSFA